MGPAGVLLRNARSREKTAAAAAARTPVRDTVKAIPSVEAIRGMKRPRVVGLSRTKAIESAKATEKKTMLDNGWPRVVVTR
jgi:hypothetical protein